MNINQTSSFYNVVDEKLMRKIRGIRLMILDVDGVLTDGRIIMDDAGRETKHFDVKDGHGIKMLIRYGVDIILLTGRRSPVVEFRARDLGIGEVHQGIHNKVAVFDDILQKRMLAREQVAFMGDDVVDIPLLKRVGFSVAVADASEEVIRCVDYVTIKSGGKGAVREVCDLILRSQDKWTEVAQKYDIV